MAENLNSITYIDKGLSSQKSFGLFFTAAELLLSAFFVLLSVPVFVNLYKLWSSDKNFDGLILVPILCVIVLLKSRQKLGHISLQISKSGLCIFPAALVMMAAASYCNYTRVAGLIFIANLAIISFGILKIENIKLMVPLLLFLILMIPLPQMMVDMITNFLQNILSLATEAILTIFSQGFIERKGFIFCFANLDHQMFIAPECSGFRSLVGLTVISSFLAIVDRLKCSSAVLLIIIGTATAITLNLFRIITTITLKINGFERFTEDSLHGLLGILVFVAGCMILSKASKCIRMPLE